MTSGPDNELDYIRWQNRAVRFYLGARLLFLHEQGAPASFCASQALESMLKATLVYWDRSFKPLELGHGFSRLLRTLRNKVPESGSFHLPEYFHEGQSYQRTSRYPTMADAVVVPASFLDDLDQAFFELLQLVPFQFNSELKGILGGSRRKSLKALRRRNRQVRALRSFLGVRLKR